MDTSENRMQSGLPNSVADLDPDPAKIFSGSRISNPDHIYENLGIY